MKLEVYYGQNVFPCFLSVMGSGTLLLFACHGKWNIVTYLPAITNLCSVKLVEAVPVLPMFL
jgi:hypothetical protein